MSRAGARARRQVLATGGTATVTRIHLATCPAHPDRTRRIQRAEVGLYQCTCAWDALADEAKPPPRRLTLEERQARVVTCSPRW